LTTKSIQPGAAVTASFQITLKTKPIVTNQSKGLSVQISSWNTSSLHLLIKPSKGLKAGTYAVTLGGHGDVTRQIKIKVS
jgi:uncharacterized membrane protein